MLVLGDPKKSEQKERQYIAVREREGRIYTDEQLLSLPDIDKAHPHYNEWAYRRQSFERLASYLDKNFKGRRLNILDLGCGNGWMSHRLHEQGHRVTGLDVNMTELEQAERVFGSSASMQWVYVFTASSSR